MCQQLPKVVLCGFSFPLPECVDAHTVLGKLADTCMCVYGYSKDLCPRQANETIQFSEIPRDVIVNHEWPLVKNTDEFKPVFFV